ncbi:MAG: hypothetical protein GT589_05865 [Peptoclostridium sp.]|uniref:hypothetical protein n=1 Tax=Peptoclostridium sp. TaxID=1904860 RepID=UPI00139B26B8|nr:hypothetical protein [Peptoclostridium sp.]MZQ75673.1 hypothetical protein [Peptoclostridium sp.]
MIRKILTAYMLIICLFYFSSALTDSGKGASSLSRDFYLENGYADTGARNIVAAIYLDYRLLDSIFETSLLLLTIAGVVHLAREGER